MVSPAPAVPSQNVQYLFRFRDLIAETIDAHRDIITKNKTCWWGWWKRPTEGNREDIWGPLAEQAKPTSPVPVLLFDSGSGKVYIAHVTAVVPPVQEADQQVAVPTGEEHLIPEYYRSSPFSRAWMQMVQITDAPNFFGSYSFAESPRVPDYLPLY